MLIKLLVSRASPVGAYTAGQEYEFPDDEARRLIAAGQAVLVGKAKVESTALDSTPARQPDANNLGQPSDGTTKPRAGKSSRAKKPSSDSAK